jgi:biotin-(acetyl-CoA carboxylase) ligase
MRKIILTLMVLGVGLSAIAQNTYGLDDSNARATKRQKAMSAWHKDMADFRSRSMEERQLNDLADSLASVQARAALLNRDFVLEASSVTFKNGSTAFINSTTNFIYLKGDKAVVQISPSNFASGPNGVGGVTVEGNVSDLQVRTDSKGRTTLSMNVMGIGINAQVEVYMYPGTSRASATVYPNFNSNTLWIQGTLVPYENANIFEGNSL